MVHLKGDTFAILSTAGYPAVLCDKTSGRKGQNFDDVALAGDSVEFVDLGIRGPCNVVDVAGGVDPDLGTQLPVSGTRQDQSSVTVSMFRAAG